MLAEFLESRSELRDGPAIGPPEARLIAGVVEEPGSQLDRLFRLPLVDPVHAIRRLNPTGKSGTARHLRVWRSALQRLPKALGEVDRLRARGHLPRSFAPRTLRSRGLFYLFLFLFLFQSAECSAIGGVQTLFSREVADGNGIGSAGVDEGVSQGLADSSKPARGTLEGG